MTSIEFLKEQLRALADFWPVFANPKFVYEVQDEVKEKKGVITIPSSSLSPDAKAFNKMIYQEGWIHPLQQLLFIKPLDPNLLVCL
jgi:hypothetical protein